MDQMPILQKREAGSCVHFPEVVAELGLCPAQVTTSLLTQWGARFPPQPTAAQHSHQQLQDFLSSIIFS